MRTLIGLFDAFLRKLYGVFEFNDQPGQIFRLQREHAPMEIYLSDGTHLHKGDPILMLHLWNEHIPPIGPRGPDFVWAKNSLELLRTSLEELALWLKGDPDFSPIKALCGDTALVPPSDARSAGRLLRRLGFDLIPRRSFLGRFGEFWENLYAWSLMWAFNPTSLRKKQLIKLRRTWVCISRQKLIAMYGHGEDQR